MELRLVFWIVFLFLVESVFGVRKRTWCCDDDEFDDDNWNDTSVTKNSTEIDEGSRLLWNRPPPGKEQRKKECPCEQSEPNSIWDTILSTIVIIMCILVLIIVLFKSIYYRNTRNQLTQEEQERQNKIKARITKRIALAKDSLIPINDISGDPDANCPICIDTLSHGEVITPLNCLHRFHRACIEQWLDTAEKEAEKNFARIKIDSLRALSCPTCATSMLPLNEQQGADDEDSSHDVLTTNQDEDVMHIELVDAQQPNYSAIASHQDDELTTI